MKLILVSNRVSYQDTPQAGGLTSALQAASHSLSRQWIGWSGEVSPDRQYQQGRTGSVNYRVFSLTEQEHDGYYLRFSNEVLWPACHLRPTYLRLLDNAFGTYCKVNALFAQEVLQQARSGDLVWVHDYQLMLLAQHLRNHKHTDPVGYFHHIPVPPLELMQTIPNHTEIFPALLAYDLVGVQTVQDVHNLLQYFMHYQRLGVNWQIKHITDQCFELQSLQGDRRTTRFEAYPIGIDVQVVQALSRQSEEQPPKEDLLDIAKSHPLIIGVDRLDYSKGLEQKMEGFAHYLRKHHELPKPVLAQIANLSRSSVPSYQQLHMRVRAQAHEIRQTFANKHYPAMVLSHTDRPMSTLAALYRQARAALVTPTKDGMNLVAKEYVAAQNPRDPGVLILSEFAGAARTMQEALLVNPFDKEKLAQAIAQAMQMSLMERVQRHRSLLQRLQRYDIHHWFDQFVTDLDQQRPSPRFAQTGS